MNYELSTPKEKTSFLCLCLHPTFDDGTYEQLPKMERWGCLQVWNSQIPSFFISFPINVATNWESLILRQTQHILLDVSNNLNISEYI